MQHDDAVEDARSPDVASTLNPVQSSTPPGNPKEVSTEDSGSGSIPDGDETFVAPAGSEEIDQQDAENPSTEQIQARHHETSSSIAEIPPPTPPTPPSKALDDVPDMHQELSGASFQEVPLDLPPPPVSKSPQARSPTGRAREGMQSSRPNTPFSARFGRKSTSDSLASPTAAHGHNRNLTMSRGNTVSVVLISSALEIIASSKEARRSAPLRDAVDVALKMVRAGEGGDRPREIFEPLRLACESGNEKLQIASLDCISKLISYSFFLEPELPDVARTNQPPISPPVSPGGTSHQHAPSDSQTNIRPPNLIDLVTHTITACHSETAPDTVSLQIVKALLAMVLSSTLLVHQSSLLKAIRTVYNIFLLSPDPVNQTVAQGGLTQMVHHVFSRIKLNNARSDSIDTNGSALPSARLEDLSAKSKLSSKRSSLTPSSPETYPLPPLTPPNGSINDREAVAKIVEESVGNKSLEQELNSADEADPHSPPVTSRSNL